MVGALWFALGSACTLLVVRFATVRPQASAFRRGQEVLWALPATVLLGALIAAVAAYAGQRAAIAQARAEAGLEVAGRLGETALEYARQLRARDSLEARRLGCPLATGC